MQAFSELVGSHSALSEILQLANSMGQTTFFCNGSSIGAAISAMKLSYSLAEAAICRQRRFLETSSPADPYGNIMLDPQAWLANVLVRLPDRTAKWITDLLPRNWRPQNLAA
jgi:hypothetical protein